MVSSGWYHFSSISRVRKYLTQEATETLIHALVLSKLDTYNSILIGIPKFQVQKLQKLQNAAAKLIVQASKFDSASQITHFLPYSIQTIASHLQVIAWTWPKVPTRPSGIIFIPSAITSGKRWRSTDSDNS